MPWFNPTPSVAELDFWKFEKSGQLNLVSHWPKPNTIRIDPKFRLQYSTPAMIPQASRWGIFYYPAFQEYDPTDPDLNAVGWFDFEVRDINHIGVTTEENFWGFTADVNITSQENLPLFNKPGIRVDIALDHPNFGTLLQHGEWANDPNEINWRHNHNTWFWRGSGRWNTDFIPPQWPGNTHIDIFGVMECYSFPRMSVGRAEFNGIDAWVDLQFDLGVDNGPFSIACDMVLHDRTNHPIVCRQSQNSGYQIIGENLHYGTPVMATNFLPAVGVEFNLRLEFEWSSQLQLRYETFLNDVLVNSFTGNRQNFNMGQLGKRNSGGNAVFGNFDMWNLIFLRGTFLEPVEELDMPLQESAKDFGPKENDGTTFNMTLPSA